MGTMSYGRSVLIVVGLCGAVIGAAFAQTTTTAKKGEAHLRPAKLPELRPPMLAEESTEVKLTSTVQGAAVGGGGRYIVLHLKDVRKLAIFDANAGKIANYIPLGSDDVTFAASAEKLVVVLRDQKIIQRWNLATAERELAKTVAVEHALASAVMGSASNGPVFLGQGDFYRNGPRFIDLDTLDTSAVTAGEGGWRVGGGNDCIVRASADGRVFTMWRLGTSPAGMQDAVLNGNTVTVRYEHDSVGDIWPSSNGQLLYTGRGVFTNELRPVGTKSVAGAIPSVQGDFYLLPARDKSGDVALHIAEDERPLVLIKQLLPAPEDRFGGGDRSPASIGMQRLYFIPDAHMLVAIPFTNDKLIVRRLDLDAALESSDVDYLFVMSRPVVAAERGKPYTYPLSVKSKRHGEKYQIASGPEGMTVSSDGRVSWAVPENFESNRIDVIVSVSDASGQEVFQSYSIGVTGTLVAQAGPATGGATLPRTGPSTTRPTPTKEPGPTTTTPVASGGEGSLPRIDPVKFTEDSVTVKLPAAYRDVCVGGGGRFLVLHLASLRQLAVFDVSQTKVVKYLPLASDDIAYTAGADRIIVALRDKKILQRWSLRTFTRDLAVSAPTSENIFGLAMGSGSTGPVLLTTNSGRHETSAIFLDGTKLQEMQMSISNPYGRTALELRYQGASMRVSADGRMFLVGSDALMVNGNSVVQKTNHGSQIASDAQPNADGTMLYSMQAIYNSDLKPVGTQRIANWPIPAVQPGYYLSLLGTDGEPLHREAKGGIAVHVEGEQRPLVSLDIPAKLSMVERFASGGATMLGPERRFYFIPDAQALVQLPATNDQLLVYKVDIAAQLEASEVDYLFVASRPPLTASAGKNFQYQLAVKSKRGGVKFELASAPDGMKISSTGLITWPVPGDFAQARQEIIVGLRDDSEQEVFHTFTLSLPDAALREQSRLAAAAQQRAAEEQRRRADEIARLAETRRGESAGRIAQAATARQAADEAAQSLMKRREPKAAAPAYPLRTWTDADGNTIEGRFVHAFGGFVTLRAQPGGEIPAIMAKLSAEDQKYIRDLVAAAQAERQRLAASGESSEEQIQAPLRLIGQGLMLSESATKRIIPAYNVDATGKPLLSWRVHMLPYIGGADLYRLFRMDEPWDSEHNKQLIAHMPQYYRAVGSKAEEGLTNFRGVLGARCVFTGQMGTRLREIADGISNTAAVIEVPDAHAVVWTKPDEINLDDGADLRTLFGLRKNGLNVALLTGEVRVIPDNTDDDALDDIFIRDDGRFLTLPK